MTTAAWLGLGLGFLAALPGLLALLIGERREAHRAAGSRRDAEAQDMLIRQLREQVAGQQETIRFLTLRVDSLERERAREYSETEALRQDTEALRAEVNDLTRGVQALIRQLEAADMTPVYRPPEKKERPAATAAARSRAGVSALRKRIAALFGREEILELAFDLQINPDELEGATATALARSLVDYMEKRDRLPELIEMCRSLRPEGGF